MHVIARVAASSTPRCASTPYLRRGFIYRTLRNGTVDPNVNIHNARPTEFEPTNAHSGPFPRRTHTCKTLSSKDVDSRVVLTGWLHPERKVNKKLSFFNLRDPYGVVQLVVSADTDGEALSVMREVPTESTVLLQGTVKMRAETHKRPYPGGDIEIKVDTFKLLNPADRNLPFVPSDAQNLPNEHLRLRHRYLDLRRSALSENLRKRSDVAQLVRNVLHERDFTEVETPMLLKSTPEGAREFLVPARLSVSSASDHVHLSTDSASASTQNVDVPHRPLFYALPQSPQQPKQLLVASGAVDRYYQLARCFRDEDGRKDRQPEFTQIDLEMAWVSWGESETDGLSAHETLDQTKHSRISSETRSNVANNWRIGGHEVREVVEALVRRIWAEVEGITLPEEFLVLTYDSAMARYGSDKPDTRFGLEIEDITSHLPLPLRDKLASRDEIIEALIVRDTRASDANFIRAAKQLQSRDKTDTTECIEIHDTYDGTWIRRSRIIRDVLQDEGFDIELLKTERTLELKSGEVVWLARRRRRPEGGSTSLGRLRLELLSLAQSLGDVTLPTDPHFLWVTEFPLFTHADADKEFLAHGRWSSSHHPFTAPMWQDIDKMYRGDIDEVRGQHYDLVLNGVEIGGGSVRVHDAAMQSFIFSEILQLNSNEKSSFEHLLHALRCGAPPHGGFAFGFDRLMAMLCKTESIRDVIAFPKTGAGTDLLFKSPAPAEASVLAQYGVRAL